MLSISDLLPLTRYKPSVFRPEEKENAEKEEGGKEEKRGKTLGGGTVGNTQSTNTSLALLQTDMTMQMLAVSGGVLNSIYPYITFTLHCDNVMIAGALV